MARRHNQRQKGIHRDPNTGVMLARDHRHPLAWVFEAVPIHSPDHPDATIPPLGLPDEMTQVLAIHVFDNLKLPAPVIEDANYRLVRSAVTEELPSEWKQQLWLPWSIGDEFVEPRPVDATPPDELAQIPVEEMTDGQLNAWEARIAEQKLARAHRDQLDTPIEPNEPGFVKYNREAMDRLERRLQAESSASSPPQEDTPE